MENNTEYYYNQLEKTLKPGHILSAMYGVIYDFTYTRSEIIMFNKLIQIYGRFVVFSAILSLAGTHREKPEDPYPLLTRICQSRFERAHSESRTQAYQPLTNYLKDIDRQIEELSGADKRGFPTSKGLEKDV